MQVWAASERAGCTASLARSFLCLLLGIGAVPVQSKELTEQKTSSDLDTLSCAEFLFGGAVMDKYNVKGMQPILIVHESQLGFYAFLLVFVASL